MGADRARCWLLYSMGFDRQGLQSRVDSRCYGFGGLVEGGLVGGYFSWRAYEGQQTELIV
jgi:hypothetical protein